MYGAKHNCYGAANRHSVPHLCAPPLLPTRDTCESQTLLFMPYLDMFVLRSSDAFWNWWVVRACMAGDVLSRGWTQLGDPFRSVRMSHLLLPCMVSTASGNSRDALLFDVDASNNGVWRKNRTGAVWRAEAGTCRLALRCPFPYC